MVHRAQDGTTDPIRPASRLRPRTPSDGYSCVEAGAASEGDQIYHALLTASTWGALRQMMPAGEFDSLTRWTDNGGESIFDDSPTGTTPAPEVLQTLEELGDEYVTRPEALFSPEHIPGFSEGDYPLFLELEQHGLMPPAFCARFGQRVTGFTSGSWWELPAERADEMKSALEAIGYVITIEIDAPPAGRSDD